MSRALVMTLAALMLALPASAAAQGTGQIRAGAAAIGASWHVGSGVRDGQRHSPLLTPLFPSHIEGYSGTVLEIRA